MLVPIVVLSQGQCILSLWKYMYVIFVFTLECYFVYNNVIYTCLFSSVTCLPQMEESIIIECFFYHRIS